MVSATDGSAFTGSVTVAVTGDAGTQATGSVGSGACAHEGNGYHTYAPAQAETNYTLVAFTFTGTGAVPATVQVFTTGYDPTVANLPANVIQLSGDGTAADNAEAFFDGTGYAGTGNVIPTVTTVTNQVTANVTAISGDSTAADNLEAYTDGTTPMPVNVTQVSGDTTAADNLESYLDGSEFMPVDAHAQDFTVSGTSLTTKKPDGTTDTAYSPKTLTTDPAAEPITGAS
jgi:hypothetical protein